MAHWNWLDWVLAVIVLTSVMTAILKGFVAELISLAAVIAAVIVASANYERVAPLLKGVTQSHRLALGISFLLLFVVVLLLGALVSTIARRLVRKVELQWFDRFLGAVFGLVRGLLVDCVVLLVMMAFAIEQGAVQKSVLAPYVTAGSKVLVLAIPGEMKNDFRAGFEQFKKDLIQNDKKEIEVKTTHNQTL